MYHLCLADCLKPYLFSVSLTKILIRLNPKVSESFQKSETENEVGRTWLNSQTHNPIRPPRKALTRRECFYEPSLMLGNVAFTLWWWRRSLSVCLMSFPDEESIGLFQNLKNASFKRQKITRSGKKFNAASFAVKNNPRVCCTMSTKKSWLETYFIQCRRASVKIRKIKMRYL